ncbi:MAG: phenylacetate--CoA ligase family protein, partial [Pseudomonadota bacterium]
GVTAISCTPSYPAVLEQIIAEQFPGLTPAGLGLQLGLFGGEPGLDDPQFRARLENTWGFKARNANYGVSDVMCNFAAQTEQSNDLHFMADDVLFAEIVDPESGARCDWQEGVRGELVLTHLAKFCQPLVRFRTGDIIELTGTDAAPCGRTAFRFRVVGRSDDMVSVRGINVFPTMIAGVVNRHPMASGEFCVVLDSAPPYDYLSLEVELADGAAIAEDTADWFVRELKTQLGVTFKVTILPFETLPRTAGKTQRIKRKATI